MIAMLIAYELYT